MGKSEKKVEEIIRKRALEMDRGKPVDDAMKYEKQIESLKRYITELLKEDESFKKKMAYQIEVVASAIVIFRYMRKKAFAEEVTIKEVSREGNERKRTNPIFREIRLMADWIRKDLRSLRMNMEMESMIENTDNDPLINLMKELSE